MDNIGEWHNLIMPIILPEMCHLATAIAISIDWLEYLVHLKEKKKEKTPIHYRFDYERP